MAKTLPPHLARRHRLQRGITLLEILISLSILGMVIAGAASLIDNHLERTRSAATAQQMTIFANAVQAYIKDNYSGLLPLASATVPAVITTSTLQPTASLTKYLPSNFNPVNAYGQTLCALVLQPNTNELYAMVVTDGGNAINDVDLALLAGTMGAAGGAIYSSAPTIAKGTLGKWHFDLNSDPVGKFFQTKSATNCDGTTTTITLTSGHPLMALWFASDTPSAYLYRDKVPGHPELNTMQTDIAFKDDTATTWGASLSLKITRTAETECDSTPTGVGAPVQLGTLARDTTGVILSCQDDGTRHYWRRSGGALSLYWGDPVENWAALTAITCSAVENSWQTRIVKFSTVGIGPRAYTCGEIAGTWSWQALAVDDAGVLRLGTTGSFAEGGNCDLPLVGSGIGIGSIAKDALGQLLVCTQVPPPVPGPPLLIWKGSAAAIGIGRYRFTIMGYPTEYFVGTGRISATGTFTGTLHCDPNTPNWGFAYNQSCGSGGTISCSPPPVAAVGTNDTSTPESCTHFFALNSQPNFVCPFGMCIIDPRHYLDAPLVVDVVNLNVADVTQQW